MPRSKYDDPLQNFRFHLFDLSVGTDRFSPTAGFNSITSPEMTIETEEIKEGNFEIPRAAVLSASVGEMTLSRGVTFWNTEFWSWIRMVATGRTDLTLIGSVISRYVKQSSALGFLRSDLRRDLLLVQYLEPPELPWKSKPGKIWLIRRALPIRYKTTGDLDATDGSVSLEELDIKPETFFEIALGFIPFEII